MDTVEARAILQDHLGAFKRRPYKELAALAGQTQTFRVAEYEVGIEVFGEEGGDLQVVGSIAEGGLRALLPLTESFVMRPDGSVAGDEEF